MPHPNDGLTEQQKQHIRDYHRSHPNVSKAEKKAIPGIPDTLSVYFIDDQIWIQNKQGLKSVGGFGSVRLLQQMDDPNITMMLKVHKAHSVAEDTPEKRMYREKQSQNTRQAIVGLGTHSHAFMRENAGKHNIHKYYVLIPYEKGLTLNTLMSSYPVMKNPGPNPKECNMIARYNVAINLVAAVEKLHTSGRIHGDLNPNNVMVKNSHGEVSLIDFDGAITYDPQTKKTVSLPPDQIIGMRGYMAPELTTQYSVQTDIYALGKLLHGLLLGKDFDQNPVLKRMIDPDPMKRPTLQEVRTTLDALFQKECPDRNADISRFVKRKKWEIVGIDQSIQQEHSKHLGAKI